MKNYMKKSAEISHVFFTFSFSFLLFLCFFRYLRLSVVLSVLFALAAACCAAALLAALLGRKRRKSLFSLRAEKEKNALALYLSVVSAKDVAQFFKTAFPARFSALPYALPSVGENLFYAHLPPQAGTEGKSGADCFFSFSAKPFGTEKSETLLRALGNASGFSVPQPDENKKYAARATLYCLAADEEASELLNRFGVQCVTIDEIFEKAKTNAALPEAVTALASEKKPRDFRFCKIGKKTARGLLVSAGILLFTSLFSPFPYYYRAMGLILLALSLAVRLLAVRAQPPQFRDKTAPPDEDAPANSTPAGSD